MFNLKNPICVFTISSQSVSVGAFNFTINNQAKFIAKRNYALPQNTTLDNCWEDANFTNILFDLKRVASLSAKNPVKNILLTLPTRLFNVKVSNIKEHGECAAIDCFNNAFEQSNGQWIHYCLQRELTNRITASLNTFQIGIINIFPEFFLNFLTCSKENFNTKIIEVEANESTIIDIENSMIKAITKISVNLNQFVNYLANTLKISSEIILQYLDLVDFKKDQSDVCLMRSIKNIGSSIKEFSLEDIKNTAKAFAKVHFQKLSQELKISSLQNNSLRLNFRIEKFQDFWTHLISLSLNEDTLISLNDASLIAQNHISLAQYWNLHAQTSQNIPAFYDVYFSEIAERNLHKRDTIMKLGIISNQLLLKVINR